MANQDKGTSMKAQSFLDELFLPRSVLQTVKDIKKLQRRNQVSHTNKLYYRHAFAQRQPNDLTLLSLEDSVQLS